MKRKFVIITAILIVFWCVGLTSFLSNTITAQYIPSNSLLFEKMIAEVDVSPTGNRTAIFNGVMESSCEGNYSICLEIESAIPADWFVEVFPKYVEHTAGVHTDNVSLIIIAPLEASHEKPLTTKLQTYTSRADSGIWYYGSSAIFSVAVAPYFRISVVCDEPFEEATLGSNVSFVLEITNQGNARDYVQVDIENKNELPNWTSNLPITLSTDEKETRNLTVNITIPKEGIAYGFYKIVINASSALDNTTFKNYPLYVLVTIDYTELSKTLEQLRENLTSTQALLNQSMSNLQREITRLESERAELENEKKKAETNLILGMVISLVIGILVGIGILSLKKIFKK